MGPNITVNVIFTNVDPPSVPEGDVITTVNVAFGADQAPVVVADDVPEDDATAAAFQI